MIKKTSNNVTIRINDEVNCVVMGLTDKDKKYFWNEYGIHVPGYHFAPKYQLGVWDGKIRFFSKTGQTYMYLLDDIIPRVINLGYKIKLSDHRQSVPIFPDPIDENFFSNIIDEKTGKLWIMRDYQVEMVNALLAEGNGIGVAGTGAGKTSITAAIALAYERDAGFKSIIIVPDKNLTVQTVREYAFFGLDVGQYSGDLKDYDHQHVVSTWQSLNHNKTLIQHFDVVIVDECFDGETKILMDDGSNKHIKDIKRGDYVVSYNRNIGTFEYDKVEKIHKNLMISSKEKMFELEFDNGSKIRITGNHKILTENRGYVRADELTKDDELVIRK